MPASRPADAAADAVPTELTEPAPAPAAPVGPPAAVPGPDVEPAEEAPPSLDITAPLDTWSVGPDELSARLIVGDDGLPRLQMRIELGLLQMNVLGRPDGKRVSPRFPTLLDLIRDQLAEFKRRHGGSAFGFKIGPDDAAALDREGRLFARRYLGWFILGDWPRVAADARHHLELLELLREHAGPESAAAVRRWFPYAIMMRARAEAADANAGGDAGGAGRIIQSAQRRLKRHYRGAGRDAYAGSAEVKALKTVLRQLRRHKPDTPVRRLRRELKAALAIEDYEHAAVLRDKIRTLGGRI